MKSPQGLDRVHAPSILPKLTFAFLHAAVLAICIWIVLAGSLPDTKRALLLLACAALYFFRHLVTLFVLLKRNVPYAEALGLSVFIALFAIGFLLLGGGALSNKITPFGILDAFALGLVLLGSYLNSASELQRWSWKKNPKSKGHCYTGGLFSYSMHINYFGDRLLFTGWAILTTSIFALIVPIGITAGVVFYHIPSLDKYLAQRYGDEFKAYAKKTARLIPYIY